MIFRRSIFKGRALPDLITEELLYQAGDYGVAHITLRDKGEDASLVLKDTDFNTADITVLAIEREGEVIHFPKAEEMVLAGDYLLCYGKVAKMMRVTR